MSPTRIAAPHATTPALSATPVQKAELYWLSAVLIGFLLLISLYVAVGTYGGSDEAAYLLTGRQLARTHSPFYHNDNPLQVTSEGMLETAPGVFVAKYPIGYPLLVAVAYWIGGPMGPFWINPLCGLVFIGAAYALFRFFLTAPWALLAGATLAFHPIIIYYATGALSHMADIAAATLALVMALHWSRAGANWRAGVAGLLLGAACSIRATDILLLFPIALLVARRSMLAPQRPLPKGVECATFLAALVVGLAPALYFQWIEFGSPFISGYHFTHEDTAFSLANFLHHLPRLLWAFNRWGEGLPIVFPVAVLGLAYAALRQRFVASFVLLWFLPLSILYCSYYWITRDSPRLYLRFYLILYPAILLALCFFLQTFIGKRRLAQQFAFALLLMLAAAEWLFTDIRRALDSSQITGTASAGATLMIQNLRQPDAAIFCDYHFALFQVYATDNSIYSADWFTTAWTEPRLSASGSPGVLTFNDLRARRLAAALKDPTDQQTLDAVLVAEIHRQLEQHPVYILTTLENLPTWNRLFPGHVAIPSTVHDPHQFALFPIIP